MLHFCEQTILIEKCFVCGSKGSTLTSTNDLNTTQQSWFEEQHWGIAIGSLLCSLCAQYFFCKEDSNVSSRDQRSNMITAAKKAKSDQLKQPGGARKHVAKHVTVDQGVDKYGKHVLYNNSWLLLCKCLLLSSCKCFGKKVHYHWLGSSICWPNIA